MALALDTEKVLQLEIEYDGEQYNRDSLQQLVTEYNNKHEMDLEKLAELRKTHDEIAHEMTKDLAEANTVWDYVKGMVTDDFSCNFKGLLEKIPLLNEFVEDMPLAELMRQKVEVADRRTRDIGQFLNEIEHTIQDLQKDIVRLNKKVVVAAHNEEKSAKHVLTLKELEARLQQEMEAVKDGKSVKARELEAEITKVRQAIWEHGAKLRLFSNAEDRIASIVKMNNNFLEILTNLHGNMQQLHDAGLEVLDELRGNLSGLATTAEAGELSLKMQESMQSLKTSVNKVAILASNTALYLTQNVERMTSEMKIYDEATEQLVQSNLSAEREIKENRINETIALAQKEYGLMQAARDNGA